MEMVKGYEKQRRLEQILREQEPGSRCIIFCSTKRMCDTLSRSLGRDFGAAAIHGDKNQTEREFVLSQFKSGRTPVLVATDVAARGLDVKDVRYLISNPTHPIIYNQLIRYVTYVTCVIRKLHEKCPV